MVRAPRITWPGHQKDVARGYAANRCCGHSGARGARASGGAPGPHRDEEVKMEFTLIDNCPVPVELADEIQKIKRLSGASLNSCDRSPEAEPLLVKCGKHSQKQ